MKPWMIKIVFALLGLIIVIGAFSQRANENDYHVTAMQGTAEVQYYVRHALDGDGNGAPAPNGPANAPAGNGHQPLGQSLVKSSAWQPLHLGDIIGPGDVVRTEANSTVDLMPTEGMGVRVEPKSLVRIDRKKEPQPYMEVALNTGKVLLKVLSSQLQGIKQGNNEVVKVKTPVATAGIRGTTFSVDYEPNTKFSTVAVADGTVNVRSVENPDAAVNVNADQKAKLARFTRFATPQPLDQLDREALAAAEKLKLEFSAMENLLNAVNLKKAVFDPVFNRIVGMIAEYEMHVFAKAAISLSPLRWDGKAPPSLHAIPIQEGDYLDPWGVEYYYEAVGPKLAVMMSAGPDRILHTKDDIFLKIQL